MKLQSVMSILLLTLLAAPATAFPLADGSSLLAEIRALEGKWDGIRFDGHAVAFRFEVTSAGSAVLMTQTPDDEPPMITMFHADRDILMLTHYCSAGNHPRMRATSPSPDGRQARFVFVDATNVSSPAEGHMVGLRITFVDDNHIELDWTWRENEQERVGNFKLMRVQQP